MDTYEQHSHLNMWVNFCQYFWVFACVTPRWLSSRITSFSTSLWLSEPILNKSLCFGIQWTNLRQTLSRNLYNNSCFHSIHHTCFGMSEQIQSKSYENNSKANCSPTCLPVQHSKNKKKQVKKIWRCGIILLHKWRNKRMRKMCGSDALTCNLPWIGNKSGIFFNPRNALKEQKKYEEKNKREKNWRAD